MEPITHLGYIPYSKESFMAKHSPRSPHTATSAEVQKNFGYWQDQAIRQPVQVTRNGRPKIVLLAVEEYERLKRRDRQALRIEELDDEIIEAIAHVKPPAEADQFDDEVD
jgi:PHD/YefM family antitoxin component YafN of YafNO toxin-antitoxin module